MVVINITKQIWYIIHVYRPNVRECVCLCQAGRQAGNQARKHKLSKQKQAGEQEAKQGQIALANGLTLVLKVESELLQGARLVCLLTVGLSARINARGGTEKELTSALVWHRMARVLLA